MSRVTPRKNFLKSFRNAYTSRSRFTQISLIIMLFVTFVLPLAIGSQLIFQQHAAENYFVSKIGVGDQGFFNVSDPQLSDVTATSLTISWTSSGNAKGEIKYWPDTFWYWIFPFLPVEGVKETDSSTDHLVVLSDLKPDQHYLYKIVSYTELGEEFTTKYYGFTTPKS